MKNGYTKKPIMVFNLKKAKLDKANEKITAVKYYNLYNINYKIVFRIKC